jgi:sec-independent protein translocase protein TatB
MFDITSSKFLILGIVALLVIGPKDLPALLRTIGKYVGMIKRQAAEFRAQFDEAMRESELSELKKDVESLGREAEESMRAAEHSLERDLAAAQQSVDTALATDGPPAELSPKEEAPQIEPLHEAAQAALNGASGAHEPAPATQLPEAVAEAHTDPQQAEKSGA